ncbi:MAG: hypothetical protein FJX63_10510, partial [Alphaproteobacteria bacterium]|nr:hypothetical protein [Alphaproteobacteria bacterium]
MMRSLATLIAAIVLLAGANVPAQAEGRILKSSNVRIEWRVDNRFRLFRDGDLFRRHELAWRQYLLHVEQQPGTPEERVARAAETSVLGGEHVLNDRFIAFTDLPRRNFDWRGWASQAIGKTCYDAERRRYDACGDDFIQPARHGIEMWLTASPGTVLPADASCEWRIDGLLVAEAPCTDRVSGSGIALSYPNGGEISVNAVGESPIFLTARVRDLLIVGLGDSFASGEGNPDGPVAFGEGRRYRNLYPRRSDGSSAEWSDRLCHRSLYGQFMRAALQLAIENPRIAVTYLDFSCSGAGIDEGLLGPQTYVERVADVTTTTRPSARPLSGGSRDSQLYRLLREICLDKPAYSDGLWRCPDNRFARTIDFVFLSVGGNDIGFSSIVAWASLRDGISATIAEYFGAAETAGEFSRRMKEELPGAYGRLAKALESSLPVGAPGGPFDPARVVLSAYPDLVTDEDGSICKSGDEGHEDDYPANQSLDLFSSWLVARGDRLSKVKNQFAALHRRMGELAGDHGWSFAGTVFEDDMFSRHGFCARDPQRLNDPA